jgi:DNA-binding XRE family transcriptional regulator
MKTNKNISTLDQLIESEYGKIGTSKRNEFEKGFEEFKLGVLIQQARLEKGMTQEQLAEKCGTNKGYISRVENNVKDVRLSTLQRIIEVGLGGKLQLGINLQ